MLLLSNCHSDLAIEVPGGNRLLSLARNIDSSSKTLPIFPPIDCQHEAWFGAVFAVACPSSVSASLFRLQPFKKGKLIYSSGLRFATLWGMWSSYLRTDRSSTVDIT